MKKSTKCALLAATAVVSLASAGQAVAQDGDSQTASSGSSENVIVVTATKSGQSLEDTAAA